MGTYYKHFLMNNVEEEKTLLSRPTEETRRGIKAQDKKGQAACPVTDLQQQLQSRSSF